MKRLILGVIVILGVILCTSIWLNRNNTISLSVVEKVMDGYIQTTSKDKPFTYNIVSLNRALQSPLGDNVWCAVITPPISPETISPNVSLPPISHILVSEGADGWWSSLAFENTDHDKQNWTEMGCGNW
jgi:hypothetical protein